MKTLGIVVILGLSASNAFAIDPGAGTGGAAFMKMFGSARAMAMGRSYVALADGADALTWNPAGLALAQTKEVTYSYMRYAQGIDAPLYMAYAHPGGRTVWGANFAYLSVGGFDRRDTLGRPIDNGDLQVRDGFGGLSAARSFWYEKLFLGTSLKLVQENNAGVHRASLVGDIGAILRPTNSTSFGFSTQNIGTSQSRVGKINRLGASTKVVELMTVSAELAKPSDFGWTIGLGAELTLPEELLSVGQVALRVGYYSAGDQGTILPENRSPLYPLVGAQGLTFGVGLYSSQAFGYGIGFDYAMVPMGALGTADYLSLKVRF